jgi:hypothetical protein
MYWIYPPGQAYQLQQRTARQAISTRAGNRAASLAPAVVGGRPEGDGERSMGDFLLEDAWVRFYLLYVAALVVINLIQATNRRTRPAPKTISVGVKTETAAGKRRGAA